MKHAAINVENVLRELGNGPATAKELALSFGGKVQCVSAVLTNLRKQGRVGSRDFHLGDHRTRDVVNLYFLPEQRT